MVLGKLFAAIDELVDADPRVMADGDSLVELHRQLARAEAAVTRATAAFDASGEWAASGARSAAHWIAAHAGVPASAAKARVRLGRELRSMPATERAWTAGDINTSHARTLAQARTPQAEALFARDEELLVGEAKRLRFAQFTRVIAYWKWHADSEGAERDDQDKRSQRRAHLSESFGGMWFGDQVFDPVSGVTVAAELKRLEQQLFDADWAEANTRLGREPKISDLRRTGAQRRADAWVEMAKRSRSLPPGSRAPRPLITVLVGYETFSGPVCQLASGTVVAPGTVARLLDEADIERVVFDSPTRVIDVGVRRRFFEGATRRAVEVRDQECFHPLCDVSVDDCQVDHIQPWSAEGLTVQENGRLACPRHNRDRHRRRPPPDTS